MVHRRTDPACRRHRPARTALGRRWAAAHRPACGRCQLDRARDLFRRMGVRGA